MFVFFFLGGGGGGGVLLDYTGNNSCNCLHHAPIASRKRAILLKVLVNVLWDVRADWERIAQSDVLISVGTIKVRTERN